MNKNISPMWFVANCSSTLSLESMNGVAMTLHYYFDAENVLNAGSTTQMILR